MAELELNRVEFEAWLRALPIGKVAGFVRSPCLCPIARFLVQKYSTADYNVVAGKTCCVISSGRQYLRAMTPIWAREFIRRIDQLPSGSISQGQALSALEKVIERDNASPVR